MTLPEPLPQQLGGGDAAGGVLDAGGAWRQQQRLAALRAAALAVPSADAAPALLQRALSAAVALLDAESRGGDEQSADASAPATATAAAARHLRQAVADASGGAGPPITTSAFCWSYIATSLVLAAAGDDPPSGDPWGPAAAWRRRRAGDEEEEATSSSACALLAELGLEAHALDALVRLGWDNAQAAALLERMIAAHPPLAPGVMAALDPMLLSLRAARHWFAPAVDAASAAPPSALLGSSRPDLSLEQLAAGAESLLLLLRRGEHEVDEEGELLLLLERAARLVEAAVCERQASPLPLPSSSSLPAALQSLQRALKEAMASSSSSAASQALLHLDLRLTLFLAAAAAEGGDVARADEAPPPPPPLPPSLHDPFLDDDEDGDAMRSPGWLRAVRGPVSRATAAPTVAGIAARLAGGQRRHAVAADTAAAPRALLWAAWSEASPSTLPPLPALEHHVAGCLAALLTPGAPAGRSPAFAWAAAASVPRLAGADCFSPLRLSAALLGLLQLPAGPLLPLLHQKLYARMLVACVRASPLELGVEAQRALLSLAVGAAAEGEDEDKEQDDDGDNSLLASACRALVAASNRVVVDRRAVASLSEDPATGSSSHIPAIALTPEQREERVARAVARAVLPPALLFPREALRRLLADALSAQQQQTQHQSPAAVALLAGPLRPLLRWLPVELRRLLFGRRGGVRSAAEADAAAALVGRLAEAGILPSGSAYSLALDPIERAVDHEDEDDEDDDVQMRACLGICERLLLAPLNGGGGDGDSNAGGLGQDPVRLLLAVARASAYAHRRSVIGAPIAVAVAQSARVLEAAVARASGDGGRPPPLLPPATDAVAAAFRRLPWRERTALLPLRHCFKAQQTLVDALDLLPLDQEQEQDEQEDRDEACPALSLALGRALDFAGSAAAHARSLQRALAASQAEQDEHPEVHSIARAIAEAVAAGAAGDQDDNEGAAAAEAARAAVVRALARWLPHASPEQARRALCVALPSLVAAALAPAGADDLDAATLLQLALEVGRRAVAASSAAASSASATAARHFAAFLAGVSAVDGRGEGQGVPLQTAQACLREACRLYASLEEEKAGGGGAGAAQRALGALAVQLAVACARAAAPVFRGEASGAGPDSLSDAWMALEAEGGGRYVPLALAPCAAALRRLGRAGGGATAAAALAAMSAAAARHVAAAAVGTPARRVWEDEDAAAEALEEVLLLQGGAARG
jgi:hypothetical protein